MRALLVTLFLPLAAMGQGYQPAGVAIKPRANVAVCLGASQAFGYASGYGYCSEANAVSLPLTFGSLVALINASASGATTANVYQMEWRDVAATSNTAGLTNVSAIGARFVVLLGDGIVNNGYSGSPSSAIPPQQYVAIIEEALAAGSTVIYVSPNLTGDEVAWTPTIQNYIGADASAILSYCLARSATGAHLFCEDFGTLTGDVATVPKTIDVNMLASSGPVAININGTSYSYTATLGADAATATAMAALVDGSHPAGCSSASASVVATTYVEIVCNGATGFVPITTSGGWDRTPGFGPSANATAFGSCASGCAPQMLAGYVSATPGHPNKTAADLGAAKIVADIQLAMARGW